MKVTMSKCWWQKPCVDDLIMNFAVRIEQFQKFSQQNDFLVILRILKFSELWYSLVLSYRGHAVVFFYNGPLLLLPMSGSQGWNRKNIRLKMAWGSDLGRNSACVLKCVNFKVGSTVGNSSENSVFVIRGPIFGLILGPKFWFLLCLHRVALSHRFSVKLK